MSTLRQVLYLSMPVAAILAFVPEQLISLLLQHGQFNHDDTIRTASILRFLAFGVPAWCAIPVLMRAFYARQETKTPVIIGTSATAVFVLLCFLCYRAGLPYPMLGVCVSIVAYALALVLFAVLRARISIHHLGDLWATILLSVWGSALCGGFSWLGLTVLSTATPPPAWWTHGLLIGLNVLVYCCAGWIYYFFTKACGMQEAEYIRRAMNRRKKKPSVPADS